MSGSDNVNTPVVSNLILIVEDDVEISDILSLILNEAGYRTVCVEDAHHCLAQLNQLVPDLMLIDQSLPEISGIDLIRKIRTDQKYERVQNKPILILTNQSEPNDIIAAIESGANDYLPKTFDRAELLHQCQSILKHLKPSELDEFQKSGKIVLGAVTLNTRSFDVFCASERIALTPSEFNLLHALALNRGKVLTRDQLIAKVQGEGIVVIDRAIDTHVFSLRKKMGQCGNLIETVRGIGYRVRETFQA